MSDQGIRDALATLRKDLAECYPDRAPYDIPSTTIDRLDAILAAHSAETTAEIAQAAVLRGFEVLQERWGAAVPVLHSDVHALLRAVLPLLGPRPLLDRDSVRRILGDVRALPVTSSTNPHVEAVMGLARPMPTQDQIEQAVATAGIGSYRTIVAQAVLALLKGEANA